MQQEGEFITRPTLPVVITPSRIDYRNMDTVGAAASISQLIAYSSSAATILVKLYKEVREGPVAFQDKENTIRHLLTIVGQIRDRQSIDLRLDSECLFALLVGISETANLALSLLLQAQEEGLFGFCWAAIRVAPALSKAFNSLQAKQDILHLAISRAILDNTCAIRKHINQVAPEMNPEPARFVEGGAEMVLKPSGSRVSATGCSGAGFN